MRHQSDVLGWKTGSGRSSALCGHRRAAATELTRRCGYRVQKWSQYGERAGRAIVVPSTPVIPAAHRANHFRVALLLPLHSSVRGCSFDELPAARSASCVPHTPISAPCGKSFQRGSLMQLCLENQYTRIPKTLASERGGETATARARRQTIAKKTARMNRRGHESRLRLRMPWAGRSMSRHQALKHWRGREFVQQLAARAVLVRSRSMRGIAEESPGAYKDVSGAVRGADRADLLRPLPGCSR